ncbi:hypothetical protein EB118_15045 [bacterium]|nr:hypothetical protein [bacterium]
MRVGYLSCRRLARVPSGLDAEGQDEDREGHCNCRGHALGLQEQAAEGEEGDRGEEGGGGPGRHHVGLLSWDAASRCLIEGTTAVPDLHSAADGDELPDQAREAGERGRAGGRVGALHLVPGVVEDALDDAPLDEGVLGVAVREGVVAESRCGLLDLLGEHLEQVVPHVGLEAL